jgi:thioredoxin reductase
MTDVVIIGGGPTAAGAVRSLRRAGLRDIVVLEREPEAGGASRHCGHTGYGLREYGRLMTGPAFAARLRAELAEVDLRTGHTARGIDADGGLRVVGPDGGYTLAPRAVLLAMGARETPRSARLIGGIRAAGVMTTGTLQQCVYLQNRRPARRVVVIGTELVAFSTILTCRHAGIEIAGLVGEIAGRRPADLVAAHIFGVPVLRGFHVESIEGGPQVTGVLLRDTNGQSKRIACDGVVFSGAFVPETSLLAGRSMPSGFFAAGNVVNPVKTAGRCFREGQAAAATLRHYLAA